MTTDLEPHPTLADVELEPILYVHPHMTLAQAAAKLDQGYGALVLTAPLRCVCACDLVRALSADHASEAPLSTCRLERPIVLAYTVSAEDALALLLDQPKRCVVVVDRAHDGIGRLSLDALMQRLRSCAPWAAALSTAGNPAESFLMDVEL